MISTLVALRKTQGIACGQHCRRQTFLLHMSYHEPKRLAPEHQLSACAKIRVVRRGNVMVHLLLQLCGPTSDLFGVSAAQG
jgi:hypothetical protein